MDLGSLCAQKLPSGSVVLTLSTWETRWCLGIRGPFLSVSRWICQTLSLDPLLLGSCFLNWCEESVKKVLLSLLWFYSPGWPNTILRGWKFSPLLGFSNTVWFYSPLRVPSCEVEGVAFRWNELLMVNLREVFDFLSSFRLKLIFFCLSIRFYDSTLLLGVGAKAEKIFAKHVASFWSIYIERIIKIIPKAQKLDNHQTTSVPPIKICCHLWEA